MKNNHSKQSFNLIRTMKKLFLSAFVTVTFVLYALHKPASSSTANAGATLPQTGPQSAQTLSPAATDTPVPQQGLAQNSGASLPTETQPPAPPISAPAATATTAQNTVSQTGLKDGTYTGPEIDAQYGLVKVQVTIQNGKIANVQVPEYPTDRRTSARINSIAVPYLQQEAVQAQSANVDLVTGATLTSEAFQMSLQDALNQAKGAL